MGTQPESRLSRKIIDALRLEGYFAFKIHGSEYMMAGLCDIIVCAEGKFIGLETKMPDKRNNVSPIQKYRHEQIREAGGLAFVICSVDEALRVVKEAL